MQRKSTSLNTAGTLARHKTHTSHLRILQLLLCMLIIAFAWPTQLQAASKGVPASTSPIKPIKTYLIMGSDDDPEDTPDQVRIYEYSATQTIIELNKKFAMHKEDCPLSGGGSLGPSRAGLCYRGDAILA